MTRGALLTWRVLPVVALAAAAFAAGCAGPSRVPPSEPPPPGTAVLVGAGDIGVCGSTGSVLTASLLDAIPGTVFTAGDNAYPEGRTEDFRDCYNPTWGRHRSRTRPTPGNHDWDSNGGAGYFDYFGSSAGARGQGYYAYTLGDWRIIGLNSEVDHRPGSPQMTWLQEELTTNARRCTIAIWHRPLFTSGPNPVRLEERNFWRVLYDLGADIIINGHDHLYERFAPQDPDARPDQPRGIRQFTVGTGGVAPYSFVTTRPNSEFRHNQWGVLVLKLDPGTYTWEFVPVPGSTPGANDSGSGSCH